MQVADFNQFGSAHPPQGGDAQHCARCEAMLADARDGTLSAADQAAFELHMAGCPSCAGMLADAQRGAAWMQLLKSSPPEPPASLFERILLQTSAQTAAPAAVQTGSHTGSQTTAQAPVPSGLPTSLAGPTKPATRGHRQTNTLLGWPTQALSYASIPSAATSGVANVLPFRTRLVHGLRSVGQTMLQPRLAMTAAMAFFSIALTMNLTGVRLSQFRASDLKPSSIKRGFYEANAHVVSYYYNLRVVYELESRVRDMHQRSADDDASTPVSQAEPTHAEPTQADPAQTPTGGQQPDDQRPAGKNPDQKQARPKPGAGSSRREGPGGNLLLVDPDHWRGSRFAPMQLPVVFSPRVYKERGGLV